MIIAERIMGKIYASILEVIEPRMRKNDWWNIYHSTIL